MGPLSPSFRAEWHTAQYGWVDLASFLRRRRKSKRTQKLSPEDLQAPKVLKALDVSTVLEENRSEDPTDKG